MTADAYLLPCCAGPSCILQIRAAAECGVLVKLQVKPKSDGIAHPCCVDGEAELPVCRLEVSQGVLCVEVKGEHWLGGSKGLPVAVLGRGLCVQAVAATAAVVGALVCCWRGEVCFKVVWLPGMWGQGGGVVWQDRALVNVCPILYRLAVHLQHWIKTGPTLSGVGR